MMPPTNQRPHGRLVSYTLPAPELHPLTVLAQAYGQERFFWHDPHTQLIKVGFGIATELFAWGEHRYHQIRKQAKNLFTDAITLTDEPHDTISLTHFGPQLFGGFAFRDDFVPDNTWSIFHPAHFVLPHYQLTQFGDESWLTINAFLPPDETVDDLHVQLRAALRARYRYLRQSRFPQLPERVTPMRVQYPLPYADWAANINLAIDQIKAKKLTKVVLSRVCELRYLQPVAVDQALAYLAIEYADCYRFLFEPQPYHAFYGATPELLVRVDQEAVTTMGLAGSIRRGQTPDEDTELAKQLFSSRKDRYEHDLVVQSIRKRLAPLTTQLTIPNIPKIYKLSNIQHLFTPIHGRLTHPTGVLPLVETLHPTPALGGTPRRPAMRFIQQTEPVPRGWYAAPIGWLDVNLDGAFAVAIRSAVSQDKRVWLYAGCGIVEDSDPELEWEETTLKFRPMLAALGLDDNFLAEDHHA
ncbi:MAG TPA: isochorismate synthase [Anaerolineae bacterium]|nr:isochorismate synthase [Anaerolineae bacterium]